MFAFLSASSKALQAMLMESTRMEINKRWNLQTPTHFAIFGVQTINAKCPRAIYSKNIEVERYESDLLSFTSNASIYGNEQVRVYCDFYFSINVTS